MSKVPKNAVAVRVDLDEDEDGDMPGVFAAQQVCAEDEDGQDIEEYPDLVDGKHFSSEDELAEYVAKQLGVEPDFVYTQ